MLVNKLVIVFVCNVSAHRCFSTRAIPKNAVTVDGFGLPEQVCDAYLCLMCQLCYSVGCKLLVLNCMSK